MLKAKWHFCTIRTAEDATSMVELFRTTNHIVGAFDTETTGLHIIADTPFLFQFGWVTEDLNGYAFAVDLQVTPELARQVIAYWNKLAATLPIYLGHNIKYDLHMLINIGLPYTKENVSDTMFYIRYAHDALTPENGGPPLKLKDYSARYIDGSAKTHEHLLDREKTAIASSLNNRLKARLQKFKPPEKYSAKSYTISVVEKMFKDKIFTAADLPDGVREEYYTWLNDDVPFWIRNKVTGLVESDMIPYDRLNRENVIKYALYDIVWTIEIWLKLNSVVDARENRIGVNVENQLIYPLLEMERVGFAVNKAYLIECRDKMAAYIKVRRRRLWEIAGDEIKISQNAKVMFTMLKTFNVSIDGTSSEVLSQLRSKLIREDAEANAGCIEFIDVIEELRTLEKWYSVYIIRFIRDLSYTDRLYTTINQVGTVSGRVTSDFQQFPKNTIKTIDGEELFAPRKMIQTTGKDYDGIIYLDYSQIELRFQALYTILVGHPDLNLCRAYMPYKCHNTRPFNCHSPECIKHAYDENWFYDEEPDKKWVATDVHGATTKAAFGIDETDPEYKHLRYVGKRVNFAKNYGAQYGKICEMFPDRTPEECHRINDAYYKAFPGVKEYHNYCYARSSYAYTSNLFGVKYYGVSGHKLINILVQGSAAFYLKYKIIALYKFSKEHNLKTRWQMQIHDELSWEHHVDDDASIFFEFKRIMEDWEDGCVPVIADMEVTTATWADKVEVETLAELQEHIGN